MRWSEPLTGKKITEAKIRKLKEMRKLALVSGRSSTSR
jgi:hypothetical protein